jgi:outer membrane protein TolC
MIRFRAFIMTVLGLLALPVGVQAQPVEQQSPSQQTFTLEEALQYAVDHYPSVRAAVEQVNVSTAGVAVARAGYLPRLESLWQTNRGTANNIFGQLLPQSVIPAMSGPVLSSESGQSVWGSAAGVLFSWEPVDFGLRRASVRAAEASVARARADESLTRLEVQRTVAAAFLAVVGAERGVAATHADVERREVLARAAQTLADNQLRPGAEASRADAERAAAQTRFIQARQGFVLAQTMLARVLGVTNGSVSVNSEGLFTTMPMPTTPAAAASTHPFAQARQEAVNAARAQENVLARTYRPRFYLQSSVFARGSGANPDGPFDTGVDGLRLERTNWAAGFQIAMPNLFEFASLRARRAASAANRRAEAARFDEAVLIVTSEQAATKAAVDAARAVAANTPVQLAAARQSETQARARYEAGLASIVEVADAQSLLAQAEYQDAIARVEVWRALLAEAIAHGHLNPLTNLMRPAAGAP